MPTKFPTPGLYFKKFSLYRILFYLGFSLDRFHSYFTANTENKKQNTFVLHFKYFSKYSMFFLGHSGVLHQIYWQPRYNWNIIESGVKHYNYNTNPYKIGICCFSDKHAAVRRKRKDWLARNQNSVSEWSNVSIRRLLFQWASTVKIQLSMLV